MSKPETTPAMPLPPGYTILNDGPGREVLVREDWEECPVFSTVAEAVNHAWDSYDGED